MITNAGHSNMILLNLRKKTKFAFSFEKDFQTEDCLFDSSDDRFVVVKGSHSDGRETLLTLIATEDELKLFDKTSLKKNSYLLNSSFPESFISNYGKNNEIVIERVFPELF